MNILVLGPFKQKIFHNLRVESIISFLRRKNNNVIHSDKKIDINFTKKNSIEYIISNGYSHKIPLEVTKKFKGKCINLHNALLPHGRGIGVNLFCLIKGLQTGVSIHEIDANWDTGDIILTKKIEPKNNETFRLFYLRLLDETNKLFFKNWKKIKFNKIKKLKQKRKFVDTTTRRRTEHLLEYFGYSYDIPIKENKKIKKIYLNNELFFKNI